MSAKKTGSENALPAPALLKRLESDAYSLTTTIDEITGKLAALRELAGDAHNREDKAENEQIARLEMELANANGEFNAKAKILLQYDKGVKEERREGEKVSVAEAKEFFAQYELTLRMALEAYILTLSQAAALCESPEAFYTAHADNLRATREGAIEAATRDGVIPAWAL